MTPRPEKRGEGIRPAFILREASVVIPLPMFCIGVGEPRPMTPEGRAYYRFLRGVLV